MFALGVRLEESIGQLGRYARRTDGIVRDVRRGGLLFGQSGDANRDVTVTTGSLWWGRTEYPISAFDTSGADTFFTYSAGGQESATASQWPNEQFDNAGTLTTMANNKWANLWFYIEPNDVIVMVYGRAEFTTEGAADNEAIPNSSLPSRLTAHSILAARLTFQKSANTATISSAFDFTFANAGVTDHGNLSGLADDDHTQYARISQVASPQTIGLTGSRLTKLWTEDLTVTNAIAGSITGNAATVTTNANLTGIVTSVGNATAIADKAIAIAKLADGTDGELITWSATGVIDTVAVGTVGHVLTSGGVGVAPTFQDAAGGFAVLEPKTSDHTANEANAGKMWMRIDSLTSLVKGVIQIKVAGVWTSGGALSASKNEIAGAGTQSAGLAFGGNTGSPTAVTEEYNGSTWSGGGAMATARKQLAGAGSQTSALSFGGNTGSSSDVTEEYNGTAWSGGGALTSATFYLAGAGTQSAGLCFGGSGPLTTTEEYNGTSWSSGGALATARERLAGCGTLTAGLSFGGTTGSDSNVTEEYNGTSWSGGGNLGTARRSLAGAGTQSAGLSFAGITGSDSTVTEEYDGTSWSAGGSINTARGNLGGAGSQSEAISFGGFAGGFSAVTENYNIAIDYEVKTFTIS